MHCNRGQSQDFTFGGAHAFQMSSLTFTLTSLTPSLRYAYPWTLEDHLLAVGRGRGN
jgi:hypothetical protein